MNDGWRSQWNRVQRWQERASNASTPVDRADFLYAFFENAFHLRDWLADTGAIDPAALETLFTENAALRLCRDLANSHKHYSLRRSSQPRPPSEVREYSPGTGNLAGDVSLVVLSDGIKHDAFELAWRILRAWDAFLTEHVASEDPI
jgi:hypothetical protein